MVLFLDLLKKLKVSREVKLATGGVVLLGVGYILYRRYFKESKKEDEKKVGEGQLKDESLPKEGDASSKPTRTSGKFQPAKTRVDKFIESAKLRYSGVKDLIAKEGELLSLETINSIHNLVFDMSEKDFKKIITTNRDQRRKLAKEDISNYEQIVIEGVVEFSGLVEENLSELISSLGLKREKYDNSVLRLSEENPQLVLTTKMIYETMIGKLPPLGYPDNASGELGVTLTQTMIETQKEIAYKPSNSEFSDWVIASLVNDDLYEKMDLEEEDLRKLLKEHPTDESKANREALISSIREFTSSLA